MTDKQKKPSRIDEMQKSLLNIQTTCTIEQFRLMCDAYLMMSLKSLSDKQLIDFIGDANAHKCVNANTDALFAFMDMVVKGNKEFQAIDIDMTTGACTLSPIGKRIDAIVMETMRRK